MSLPFELILIFIFAISMLAGLFIFLRPTLTIELQRRFYERINWRIEPISMVKEIRNTRAMGLSLIVITVAVGIYLAVKIFKCL